MSNSDRVSIGYWQYVGMGLVMFVAGGVAGTRLGLLATVTVAVGVGIASALAKRLYSSNEVSVHA